jgi:uncharacterized lipoprotein YddW (UPF0748 family)
MTRWWAAAAAVCFGVALSAAPAAAQEYRAFWVDTFNTALNNHTDVVTVVDNAKLSNANALFVQVRRRGDSWYLNSLEPLPEPNSIQAGFDPLDDLITVAHSENIEVHAFVIIGAVWNRHPIILGLPASPNHLFGRHGGFDPVTRTIVPGPNNWLTRTLLPDGGAITFQGHRFGGDFWMDPGHPDAAADTVNVLTHLVNNYDIDGLHLDRIRYPEFSASGQTPANGTNIGYNSTNVERFQRHYGIDPAGPPPATGDPRWMQWRRDQVTNLVRRIYLNTVAAKPQLKVSAALIAFGGGPANEAAWPSAEAYWRVYQDWRAWIEEGILDLAMPMLYKREHNAEATQYNQWLEWTKNHQYDRAAVIGQGAFVNGIEGTLRQVRRAQAPSALGRSAKGVIFFSMATSNVAVSGNPFAIPAPITTPARPFAEFASGLTTGASVKGFTFYQPPTEPPVFSDRALVPVHPWKKNPQVGHIKGLVKDESGAPVDTGAILIQRLDNEPPAAGRTSVTNATDGGGFYGGVDLVPGTYRVTVTPVGEAAYTSCAATAAISAGTVSTLDIMVDRTAPTSTISADPGTIWPPNGHMVTVRVSGQAADVGTGVTSIAFRVLDEYGQVEPSIAAVTSPAIQTLGWSRTVQLQAARLEEDKDGRTYTIEATLSDSACNNGVVRTTVVVLHDRRGGV